MNRPTFPKQTHLWGKDRLNFPDMQVFSPFEASMEFMNINDKASVSKVQQKLKDLGYLGAAIDGSWVFGLNEALAAYKTSVANLPDDSAWDVATQTALFGS
jgi:hypothetical protein